MEFEYTQEQLALQDTLGRFYAREYSFEHRRGVAQSVEGFDRKAWSTFAKIGILALPFPEEYGGLNGNAVDSMLVMEMLGRGLALEPYLSTVVLCGGLIRDAGSAAQCQALLPAIGRGEKLLGFAHFEPQSRYERESVATTAKASGTGWKISGAKSVVIGGPAADVLITSAREDSGLSLFLVDAKSPGVRMRAYKTQDGGRAADIEFADVAVGADARLGPSGGAIALIERALDCASAALCAESVGIMSALQELTLEYLKTRQQFGVPIGRFQALQHRMADMVIAIEQARSMAILAAVQADNADADARRRAVAGACAYVDAQARFVGQQAVQLHGGMGVTDEINVAHYFKRLTMIGMTYGDADFHLRRFSDTLLAS
ncbi:MAG TPA: acyl-CoA dehydrogenase family protein [Burkholderiaceae bacterium]|nr:acyl-CoA dehydrogenase family protein [Burkholderiaceae bacterium]